MGRVSAAVVLFLSCLWALPSIAQSSAEIPFERCDRLLTVKVSVDGMQKRFLVDSGATTMLNLKSFAGGDNGSIKINSWAGTAATSAREVLLPKLSLGSHELRNLKLPAIDLSPIGSACGGQIDGIFGVDLMEKMGVKIDFEKKLLSFQPSPDDVRTMYDEMEASMHPCMLAFEHGKDKEFADCLDPDIVLYTHDGEFVGRAQVLQYMKQRFFQYAPNLTYAPTLRDVKIYGDALWYSYDYLLETPKESIVGYGMSMCRKSGGRWRMLNMHNSEKKRVEKDSPAGD